MTLDTTLPSSVTTEAVRTLALETDGRPGAPLRPVHVVYGGAHLFQAGTIAKIGERARTALETWAKDDADLARVLGLTAPELAAELARRVRAKLRDRPVEALCIDFEDGYGPRSDGEEDAEAVRAATELAKTEAPTTSIGIRVKALAGTTTPRAVRTLDLFVTTLARSARAIPAGFSVTLPKVTSPREVGVLADLLERLESALGIEQRIAIELMIESPAALVGPQAIAPLVEAARGRVVTVHLGAYDLTADLGVTATDQRLDHPYCDLARMFLKLGTFGTAVGVSDGATTTLPIAPKGASPEASAAAVHRAWSLHASNVRRAIDFGIWQGWDLHPAQLPARYGALFGYFLSQRQHMTERLRSFIESASRASRVGQAFDDAATGYGLISFFARGLACGALGEDDLDPTTLTREELALPFAEIVRRRRGEGA